MFVKDITIGDVIKDGIFVLAPLEKTEGEEFRTFLSDKTGKVAAVISAERFHESYEGFVSGAVKVAGTVLDGSDGACCVKIKSMALAQAGEYRPSDLFDGLTEEKVMQYTASVRDAIKRIPDPRCRALCCDALDDTVLSSLAEYPASIGYQARFRGGALAQTATVTRMALQMGIAFQKNNNGLYGGAMEWSILLCGALLHMIAIPDYLEEQPWRRTSVGIDRGYMSLLQSRIERANQAQNAHLTPEKLARLLNVLQAIQPKSFVRATTQEGVLLRQAVTAFIELDMLDAAIAESSHAQFFDIRTRRHINTVSVESREDAA